MNESEKPYASFNCRCVAVAKVKVPQASELYDMRHTHRVAIAGKAFDPGNTFESRGGYYQRLCDALLSAFWSNVLVTSIEKPWIQCADVFDAVQMYRSKKQVRAVHETRLSDHCKGYEYYHLVNIQPQALIVRELTGPLRNIQLSDAHNYTWEYQQ